MPPLKSPMLTMFKITAHVLNEKKNEYEDNIRIISIRKEKGFNNNFISVLLLYYFTLSHNK